MKLSERQLWYLLDVVATRESGAGNHAKAQAAVSMMQHLQSPTPPECRSMYESGYDVELPIKIAA